MENEHPGGRVGCRQLTAVAHALERVDFPYEEWEVLFRQQLLVERRILEAGSSDRWLKLLHAPTVIKGRGAKAALGRKLLTRGVLLAASIVADRLAAKARGAPQTARENKDAA